MAVLKGDSVLASSPAAKDNSKKIATTEWVNSNVAGAVGGGTDNVFYENSQVVTENYTITTGKNAMTAGDITINNGVTVTIPTGSRWVIV